VDATSDENMDRVSTTAYAFGYIGGSTIPLIVSIVLLQVLPGMTVDGRLSLLGRSFPYDLLTGFRVTFVLTAFWWLLFALPFVRNVGQVHGIDPERAPVRKSFLRLGRTFADIRAYKAVFLFLAAYFLYIDGVHTVISMAVPFATDAIEAVTADNATEILLPILLAIQVVAFFFALIFAWLSKKFRTRTLLFVTIGVYCAIAVFAVFITSVAHFWVLGMMVATSQGAIQSLSRSYYGKIIPKDMANEFFGFYTIFGRFAAVLGPALVGGISLLVYRATGGLSGGTMRFGVLSLVVLFVSGAALFRLSEKGEREGAR
jgi:UMF1 family MFS transporter